jgi:MFS family permease
MLETVRGHDGRQLNVHTLGIVVSLSGILVVAPLLPSIVSEFGITDAAAGASISFMWACNALAQYPGGRYAEQLSANVVLLASQGVMTAGFMLLFCSATFPVFVAGLGLIGFGYGLFEPAGMVLIQNRFDERRGRAFGLRDAAVNLGSALSALLAITVVGATAWRRVFLPVVGVLAFVAVGYHRVDRDPYPVARVSLDVRSVLARLFRSRETYALLVALSVFNFVWQGSASFVPTFLRAEKSFTSVEAAVAFAGLFAVGIVVTPVAGALCERWTPIRIGLAATGASIGGLVVLVEAAEAVVVAAGLVVFAVGLTAIWPVMYVYLVDVLDAETVGSDLGALRAVYFAVGSLGPLYVGTAATYVGYARSFASLIAYFGLAAVTLVWLGRR